VLRPHGLQSWCDARALMTPGLLDHWVDRDRGTIATCKASSSGFNAVGNVYTECYIFKYASKGSDRSIVAVSHDDKIELLLTCSRPAAPSRADAAAGTHSSHLCIGLQRLHHGFFRIRGRGAR